LVFSFDLRCARDREDGVVVGLIKPDILIEYSSIHGDFLTHGLAGVIDVVLWRRTLVSARNSISIRRRPPREFDFQRQ
jgi:hypothetical protein